ncbi:MFS general substrate transporter [Hypoxylon trugodes]|uniref:MFS general substrate transporter n=1 Tax=Hypoxylon trugodes TaxID=326681 RepID=UPI0021A1034B|nr:MFS general substrate transporter [Hypoxylon trugodes]KAI1392888.1 MFS general substrate transporter [Hypoxylon trugodes]
MIPYRLYYIRSGSGPTCTATLVIETVEPGKRQQQLQQRKGDMEEDGGHRASSPEDDASSVYHSTSSHEGDGRASRSSTECDTSSQSNVTRPHSVSPFWLAEELIGTVSGFKAAHSRELSSTSSKTLTGGFSETGSQVRLHSSSLSEADRYTTLADLLIDSAPHLRHLATIRTDDSKFLIASSKPKNQLVTPVSEQRHPGKPGARISKSSKLYEPDIPEGSDEQSQQTSTSEGDNAENDGFLKGIPLILLTIGLSLVVFLISIDRTIITTAIPFITSEFQSTADIGWYGSSYLLTACAFQPVFGRVFTLFNAKWSYLLSMLIFEVGSIISGFAPTSASLIIGRAIAGFGSAGILTGSFVIVATAVPLTVRPIYTAVVGLMFGVGATVGPLIGGVFTDLVTWRWCFWINLPVGAVTIIVMILVYHPKPHVGPRPKLMDRLVKLDLIGNLILLGAAVMLFLALEYTLTGAAWASAEIIGLLAGAGVTAIIFVGWLWWKQDRALIPPAIAKQRTVAASCLMAFFTYGALLVHTYFLPIWFQAILGYSAIESGVAMIPYFVANALFSVLSGVFVSGVGYFTPPAILGSAIGTVGCGIITLFRPTMSTGAWIGFEVLASAGFGMSIQQGFTAVQTVLGPDDLAVGTAAVVACQSLGGAVFISVGNSVFQNRLASLIEQTDLPGLDVRAIVAAGAVAFRKLVPADELPALLDQYNAALHTVLLVAVPLGGLAFLSCCMMEWKSVKKPATKNPDAEKAERTEAE